MRRVRSDTLRVYREGNGLAWVARRAHPPDSQALLPWQIPSAGPLVHAGHVDGLHPAGVPLVLDAKAAALLHDRPREALLMATASIPLWLLFEGYNARLRNWAYFGVPEDPWVAAIAYAWAFATISPAIFETAALMGADPLPWLSAARPAMPLSARLRLAILVGAAFVTVPPLLPYDVRPWTFGFVWLGFVLLLDPLNAHAGRPSFLAAWRAGDRALVWQWLLAGIVCGLLWEFWNYWALAKWRYVGVPVFPSLRLFEMPLAGVSGFPAVRARGLCDYHFCGPCLGRSPLRSGTHSRRLIQPPRNHPRRSARPWRRSREALRDEESRYQTIQDVARPAAKAAKKPAANRRSGLPRELAAVPTPKPAGRYLPAAPSAKPAAAPAAKRAGANAAHPDSPWTSTPGCSMPTSAKQATHPDPWRYAAKARGWGERAQVIVELITVRGATTSALSSAGALVAELDKDRDFQGRGASSDLAARARPAPGRARRGAAAAESRAPARPSRGRPPAAPPRAERRRPGLPPGRQAVADPSGGPQSATSSTSSSGTAAAASGLLAREVEVLDRLRGRRRSRSGRRGRSRSCLPRAPMPPT